MNERQLRQRVALLEQEENQAPVVLPDEPSVWDEHSSALDGIEDMIQRGQLECSKEVLESRRAELEALKPILKKRPPRNGNIVLMLPDLELHSEQFLELLVAAGKASGLFEGDCVIATD